MSCRTSINDSTSFISYVYQDSVVPQMLVQVIQKRWRTSFCSSTHGRIKSIEETSQSGRCVMPFPKSSIYCSGASACWLNVCVIPSDNRRLPMPGAKADGVTVITIRGPGFPKKVYRGESDGTVRRQNNRGLRDAETLIIRHGGAVSGHPYPCRTSRAAREMVTSKFGAGSVATVISADEKEQLVAFRVTVRTVRRLPMPRNPPSLSFVIYPGRISSKFTGYHYI